MVATAFVLAASSIFAFASGAPLFTRASRSLVARDTPYKKFGGDGTPSTGWPVESEWKSFDELWDANLPTLQDGCGDWGAKNSEDEIKAIKAGLETAAQESGVKIEFIFAIMMQESRGCVRAPTTNYGVRNPGLMQSHDGSATCNEGGVKNPCPDQTITDMILQGAGVGTDFGLKQTIEQSGSSGVDKYYKGARIYNSGSVAASGNLGDGIATHCYASDIANRLVGWATSTHDCDEGSIGGYTGSPNNTPDTPDGPESTPTPKPTPTKPAPSSTPKPTKTPAPVPTYTPVDGNDPNQEPEPVTPGGGDSDPNAPKAPGYAQGCKKWYVVKSGDTCSKVANSAGITFDKLRELNSELNAKCSNLWLEYAYCTSL